MLTTFTGICNFFAVAASVWWMLQLFDGFFSARQIGKRACLERALLTVFAILFHWGMINLSRYLSIGDEIPLLMVLGVMSIGVHLVYECHYLDIICLNILGWGVLILGELFFLACAHLFYGGLGIPQTIFSYGLMAEGLYLAAVGILLLSSGVCHASSLCLVDISAQERGAGAGGMVPVASVWHDGVFLLSIQHHEA